MHSELPAVAVEMRERELVLLASQLRERTVKERPVQGHRRLMRAHMSLECGRGKWGGGGESGMCRTLGWDKMVKEFKCHAKDSGCFHELQRKQQQGFSSREPIILCSPRMAMLVGLPTIAFHSGYYQLNDQLEFWGSFWFMLPSPSCI